MTDLKQILTDAKHEIEQLRRQNELLRAKQEMIDLFACVLYTKPAERLQAMQPDVIYQLERLIAAEEQTPAVTSLII